MSLKLIGYRPAICRYTDQNDANMSLDLNLSSLNVSEIKIEEPKNENFNENLFGEAVEDEIRIWTPGTPLGQAIETIDVYRFCVVCRLMKLPFPNSTLVDSGNVEIGELLHLIYQKVHSWVICFCFSIFIYKIIICQPFAIYRFHPTPSIRIIR